MKKILITTLMAMLMTATIFADETIIPPKPEGIEEMPPSVNMTITPVLFEEYYLRDKMGRDILNIHKLSETEKADYQRLKELEKPGWAKTKEK